MARAPFAKWNPVKFRDRLDKMHGQPRAVFIHTNDGGPHLTGWFNGLWEKDPKHARLGCTFQVFNDGSIDQLCETNEVIYAQYGGSLFGVSIETEDDGHPSRPWTRPQIDSIVRLTKWLHETHGIPLHLMTGATDSGIGYHQQFAVNNKSGHNCPGPVRLNQLLHTVMPRLHGQAPAHDPDSHGHAPQPLKPLPLPADTESPDAKKWQKRMRERGWHIEVTGRFDAQSKTVCHAFQHDKGIPETGQVDEQTWAAAWTTPITH